MHDQAHGTATSPTQTACAPAVVTVGLTRRFDAHVAVDELDLCIERGVCFGLIGSNGAGKTTLMKMLTTLLPPSSGRAQVAGFDVVRQALQVRRHIGYVPQLISADAALTGRENLRLFAKLYGLARAEREARVQEALAFMDLLEVGGALVRTYSGGMIRRLEIAQALMHRPEIVFLDEPTVGLDPVAKHSVWDRLAELRVRFGTTVLITTHEMDEAEALCDEIAIMHRGRLVARGSAEELKHPLGTSATMDDAFAHYTGGRIDEQGGYGDVARARRTSSRLG
jgi:ABC-2 type transport system ATP-binding protein